MYSFYITSNPKLTLELINDPNVSKQRTSSASSIMFDLLPDSNPNSRIIVYNVNSKGKHVLHKVLELSKFKTISYLESLGVKFYLCNYQWALINGYNEVAKSFIKMGDKIENMMNRKKADDSTFLFKAALTKNFDIIKHLIEETDFDINKSGSEGFAQSLIQGDDSTVRYLLKSGFDPKGKYEVLKEVIFYGDTEAMKLLVKKGMDVRMLDDEGFRDACRAASNSANENRIPIVKYFLNIGCDPNMRGGENFERIVKARCHEAVKLFIKKGIQPQIIDRVLNVITSDLNCLDRFDEKMIKILVGSGATPAGINKAFLNGSRIRKQSMMKYLIKAGADISCEGNCAIKNGIKENNIPLLVLLSENGADLRFDGDIALVLGVKTNSLKMVEYLVNSGLDPNANNTRALTCIRELRSINSPKIAKYLISKGADINADGVSVLKTCIKSDNLPLFKYLVDNGANLESIREEARVLADKGNGRIKTYLKKVFK